MIQKYGTRRAWRAIAVTCAGMAATGVANAYAETKTLELRGNGTTATVSSQPESLAAKDTLSVVCAAGVNCLDVRASLGAATVLDPSASPAATATQVAFTVPDAVKAGTMVQVRVCAAPTTPAACMKTPAIAQIAVGASAGSRALVASDRHTVLAACNAAGTARAREIAGLRGGRSDFTVILFDETGPCYLSRQFGAEGDPIAVGFVSTSDVAVSVDLDPCGVPSATPKVLISADISSLTLLAAEEPDVRWFPPLRRCFGPAAGIKLTVGSGDKARTLAYTLKQFERYRATLQLGVAASELHQRGFALRTAGTTKRIFETTPEERGPEYVASVVIYGVPHYFARRSVRDPSFADRGAGIAGTVTGHAASAGEAYREPYWGRDPVNDNGVMDRIGLLLGAGINQPGRRFLVGGSLELLTGVNAFFAREFVRTPELEGVAVGDEFTGEAAALPLRDHWRMAWTGGISIDARYALALFGRK